MDYFVTHWLVILIAKALVVDVLHINDKITILLIVIATCIVLLPLLSRFLSGPRYDRIMGRCR